MKVLILKNCYGHKAGEEVELTADEVRRIGTDYVQPVQEKTLEAPENKMVKSKDVKRKSK